MQIVKKIVLEEALPDMSLTIDGCPPALTDLMTQCLSQVPGARPSFASVVPTLQEAEAMVAGSSRASAAITATLRTKRPGGGDVEERVQVRWSVG